MLHSKLLALSFLTAILSACTDGPVETPGNMSNPKLADLINAGVDEDIEQMTSKSDRRFISQAGANARLWLKDITEVVARCKYGPNNNSRFNLFEYDITLATGEVIPGVFSARRCRYDSDMPLVMRVKFKLGRAVDVSTDGRELKHPLEKARPDLQGFVETVLKADLRRNPALYLKPQKTAEQIAKEWAIDR